MSAIGISIADMGLLNFLVVGEGAAEMPYPSWWTLEDDLVSARRVAMAWLICGFASRVIDLKLADRTVPEIPARYDDLQSVMTEAAAAGVTISKYCMQLQPPVMPSSFADDPAYFNWLKAQSEGTPTYPVAKAAEVHAQEAHVPAPQLPPQRVTAGVTHIRQHSGGGTLCGAAGHSEPDVPFEVPLRRSLAASYCPECVRVKSSTHQDFVRGWSRSQAHQPSFYVPGTLVDPAQQEAYRLLQEAQERTRPRPVWAEPVTVTVNGRERVLDGTLLDYAEVAGLAPEQAEPTITFREKGGHHGTLAPGGSLLVRAGTVFNIHNTGSA